MSMDISAWTALQTASREPGRSRRPAGVVARRILSFARPHRRRIAWFLLASVVGAALTVATPVLAGRVVNAIVDGRRVWPCSPASPC